ncbi:MAG: hypothetical protein M3071_02500 [Actinomycetota bacterium]|nr:hypothetical protein [Actinomycetota bacterium]
MNEFRRGLLDDRDAPPELSPNLVFMGSRNASLAALVPHHAELYRHLLARYRREGWSPDIEAIALDAAGNLATLMQSFRRREDLLIAMEVAPNIEPPPMIIIDQLLFSFVLLTKPDADDNAEGLLSEEALSELLANDAVQLWLKDVEAPQLG